VRVAEYSQFERRSLMLRYYGNLDIDLVELSMSKKTHADWASITMSRDETIRPTITDWQVGKGTCAYGVKRGLERKPAFPSCTEIKSMGPLSASIAPCNPILVSKLLSSPSC
jgi:hypothetical protein